MFLVRWENLPDFMKNDSVRDYYDILAKKSVSLAIKRMFDIIASIILLVLLSPAMLVVGLLIKIDSPGEIFFRQTRVTQYGKKFRIFKFRTMVQDAANNGPGVTTKNDARITKIGEKLRNLRLDEIPQLINVLFGQMTFVGTRPESVEFVEKYTDSMFATLLLPAGVTSFASIKFKNESQILDGAQDPKKVYVDKILPEKMKFNLKYLSEFSFIYDVKIMIMTIAAVLKK